MEDQYALAIEYNGKTYDLEMRLAITGYTHKFYVTILDSEIVVEMDEERNYRVIAADADIDKFDTGLLQTIVQKIESLSK